MGHCRQADHDAWQKRTGLGPIPVGVGLHDSNAALLPYLIDKNRDARLCPLSTGTWCVGMHQVPTPTYQPHEIGSKIIFNVDALGGWQKVSFLMGGQDYALYHDLIGGDHVNEADPTVLTSCWPVRLDSCRGPRPASSLAALAMPSPATTSGVWQQLASGQRPAWWSDTETAHHLLNISLALQAAYALHRTDIEADTAIYVEGGFRHNGVFLGVLAAQLAPRPVYCTDIGQASALGAGIAAWAGVLACHPSQLGEAIQINASRYRAAAAALADYAQRLYTAAPG